MNAHRTYPAFRGPGSTAGRITLAVAVVVSALVGIPVASAFWNSAGSAYAVAKTGALAAPVDVAVPAAKVPPISVGWKQGEGGPTPQGYYVTRVNGSTRTPACQSGPTSLVHDTACTDDPAPGQTVSYVVTAVYKTWAAKSAPSRDVSVLSGLGIATTTLPDGMVGDAYTAGLAATGGLTPFRWTATGLPAGLSLDSSTGLIFGTPTDSGNASVTLTVTDAGDRIATSTLALRIAPALAVATTALPAGLGDAPYSATLAGTGGTKPYTWSVSGLPAGLALDATTGVVSGSPTGASGPATVSVTLTDALGHTLTRALTLTVDRPVTVAAGYDHTCAVLASGSVKCWGKNGYGQLGDGTTTASAYPVQVRGLTSGATSVTTGLLNSCAVVSGAVKCWGYNTYGQLGNGAKTDAATPVQVTGLTSGATAVSLGVMGYQGCALVSGAAKCWGANWSGELGDGTTTDRLTPVQVTGLGSGVTAVSAGTDHSCAVVSGAAKCWGSNGAGKLGNGSSDDSLTPVQVTGLDTGVTAIVAGDDQSCAVASGAAKCWGYNNYGQLGDGTTTNVGTPVQVVGLTSGVSAISFGQVHGCAIASGSLKCWGYNRYGELGDGTNTNSSTPVQVAGLTGNVTAVAAGLVHTCAMVSGSAQCWGNNPDGQVGDGTTTDRTTPVRVGGLAFGVATATLASAFQAEAYSDTLVAAGGSRPYTWQATGLPAGFGVDPTTGVISGTPGTTGTWRVTVTATDAEGGTTEKVLLLTVNRPLSITTASLPAGVADDAYTTTLSGTGENVPLTWAATGLPPGLSLAPATGVLSGTPASAGSWLPVITLTDNQGVSRTTQLPLQVKPAVSVATTSVPQAVVGDTYSSGLVATDGTAPYTWSATGLPAGLSLATDGTLSGVPQAAGTTSFTVTVTDAHGRTSTAVLPLTVNPPLSIATASFPVGVVGDSYSSQLEGAGGVGPYTWSTTGLPTGLSRNVLGAIYGTPSAAGTSTVAVTVTDARGKSRTASLALTVNPVLSVSTTSLPSALGDAPYAFTVAGAGGIAPYSWAATGLPAGLSLNPTTGAISGTPTGAATSASVTITVTDARSRTSSTTLTLRVERATAITGGNGHTCALLAAGSVKCWGWNTYGQLGDGTTTNSTTPVQVSGLTSGVTAVSAGAGFTCAVAGGKARCWGRNDFGQLGDGTTVNKSTSVQVSGLTTGVMAISGGAYFSCAIVSGATKCWGQNTYGQLGNGTMTDSPTPVPVTGLTTGTTSIGAGFYHGCAATSAGAVSCWGRNDYGQRGDGTTTNSTSPVQVSGLGSGVSAISIGGYHSCALVSGASKCWGNNTYGQLGDGSSTNRSVPVPVGGFSTGVTAISAGAYHSCALVSGSAQCLGSNVYGQLGDGTTTNRSAPVQVSGLTSGVTLIGSAQYHVCAIASGVLKCWGNNPYGQLGDGTTTSSPVPVTVQSLVLGVATSTLPVAYRGEAYSATLLGTGGSSYAWSATGLPAGLSLESATGVISGTPTTVGRSTVTVTITDAAGKANVRSLLLTVSPPLAVTTVSLPQAVINNPYVATLAGTAEATPFTWSVTGLPAGILLNSLTGALSGTPTVAGTSTVAVTITDSLGNSRTRFVPLTVNPALAVATTTLVPALVGESYSRTLIASGGIGPYAWSANGLLPDGITVDPSGILSGTPTTAGTYNLDLRVTDSGGRTSYAVLPLTIGPAVSITTSTLPVGVVNEAWTTTLTANGGTAPYTWAATGVPDGLSLNGSTGVISGIPTVAGNPALSITVTDAHAMTSTVVVDLVVNPAVSITTASLPAAMGDESYAYTLKAAGGTTPYAWAVTGLPPGVALNQNTGLISGTPTGTAADASVSITITDAHSKTSTKTLSLTVERPLAIATGSSHSCAVLASGSLKCWGLNNNGQLGNGTTTDSRYPVQVSGLTSGVTAVSASGTTTCAVVSGSAKCWGYNNYGQLGDGTTTNSSTPVQVAGLTSGVTAVAAGGSASCALVSGAAKCWGYNNYGQLGDGTTTNSSTPVQVAGLTTGVTGVASAGSSHACAVVSGAAKCWGFNGNGRLGDNTILNSSSPVQVLGLTAGVTTVSVGNSHSCAVVSGAAKCWGFNSGGVVGDGSAVLSITSPVQVSGLTTGVTALAAGPSHTCAIVGGSARCWGYNPQGQLGDGTTTNASTPVQVSGLTTGVTVIAAGQYQSCAMVSGSARCWGNGSSGQLGDGTTTSSPVPVRVTGLVLGVASATLPDAYRTYGYTTTLVGTGGATPYTWAATGLPAGLAVNSASGVVSGTPTTVGISDVTITVTDAGGRSSTRVLALKVNPGLAITTTTLPSAVANDAYTLTLAGAAELTPFTWSATGLPAGLTLDRTTGVISGTPSTAGSSTITITITDAAANSRSNTWFFTVKPAVSITTAGLPSALCTEPYTTNLLAATGGTTPYTWSATGLPAGLAVNATTGTISGTPTVAGTSSVSITVTDAHAKTSTSVLSLVVKPAVSIATTSLPMAVVAEAYTTTLAGAGGTTPYTWAASGLPAGLSLNAGSGVISGTPTTAGPSSMSITVTDNHGRTSTTVLTLTVNPVVSISTTSLPNAVVNEAYSAGLVGTGGTSPYTWAASGLPAGLALDTTTGVISGTPTVASTVSAGVTVTDARGRTATGTVRLTVGPAVSITTTSLPAAVGEEPYSFTVLGAGGTTPYAWSAVGMPVGLSLDAVSGTISGTPTGITGSTNVSITITDAHGKTANKLIYLPVERATSVAAGANFSCALLGSGGVKCWGDNTYGQLGNGSTTASTYPVQVSGLTSNVTAISAGAFTTCAVVSGAAKCWGENSSGQLGNGTKTNSTTPVQVSTLTAGVTAINVGLGSNCAVVSGAAKCWGYNGSGQLGNSTMTDSSTPVQVTGLTSGVTAVAAGNYHSCAVVANTAKCWGYNADGELGNSATIGSSAPVQVTGLTAGVTAIAAGAYHSCAVVSNAAKCWGNNGSGQLGNGTTTGSNSPVQVTGLTSGVSAAGVAADHTCALVSGAVRCWGKNNLGQLGNGSLTSSLVPVQVTGLTAGVTRLATTNNHACAVASGSTRCWGRNAAGQLGDGTTTDRNAPVKVVGIVLTVVNPDLGTVFKGSAYTATLTGSGGSVPYTWDATGLPAGLALNSTTGVISGTPTVSGLFTVPVTITDAGDLTNTVSLPLDIKPALSITTTSLPAAVVTDAYSTTLGGTGDVPPLTWAASGLPDGLTVNSVSGVISGAATSVGTTNVTITITDGGGRSRSAVLPLTVNPVVSISTTTLGAAVVGDAYSAGLGASAGTPPYSWTAAGLPAGLSLDSNGVLLGTPTSTGASSATFTVTDAHGMTSSKLLTVTVNPALSVSTTSVPDALATESYSTTLVGAGGIPPYTWSASALPAGLALNSTAGVISGTPTASGISNASITLTDSRNKATTVVLPLTVKPAVSVSTTSLATGVVNEAYSTTLAAAGGTAPYTWAASGLLLGLTLDPATGVISGTAGSVGTSSVPVTVTDAHGKTSTKTLTLTVSPAVSVATGALPVAVQGAPYSTTLAGAGGTAPYTWAATGLPAGLSVNSTSGVISGTATAPGSSSVTLTVTDAHAKTSTRSLTLTVDGVVVVAAGGWHSCALLVSGGVKCWGDNANGQLGNGTYTGSSVPVSVTGLTSGVTAVSVGNIHSCAVVGGAARCWGDNSSGQLGNGSTTRSTVPVQVSGLASSVDIVVAGGSHSCAAVSGSAKCWGSNAYGQLGNASTTQSSTAVQVSGMTSGVTGLAAGGSHTCAVVSGSAKCWGTNVNGRLGDGTTNQSTVPVQVSGLTSGVTAVAGYNSHSCAVVSGSARCWGDNQYGALGNGTTTQSLTPVQVTGLSGGVSGIAAGSWYSCAAVSGAVKCWGSNLNGQLGNGTTTQSTTPVDVSGLASGAAVVAAGGTHACAVVSGGARCWGFNGNGRLGDGTTTDRNTPVPVLMFS